MTRAPTPPNSITCFLYWPFIDTNPITRHVFFKMYSAVLWIPDFAKAQACPCSCDPSGPLGLCNLDTETFFVFTHRLTTEMSVDTPPSSTMCSTVSSCLARLASAYTAFLDFRVK